MPRTIVNLWYVIQWLRVNSSYLILLYCTNCWKRNNAIACILELLIKARLCPHMWARPRWPKIFLMGLTHLAANIQVWEITSTTFIFSLLEWTLLLQGYLISILKSTKSVTRICWWESIRCTMIIEAFRFIALLIKSTRLLSSHGRISSSHLLRGHRDFIVVVVRIRAFTSLF